MREICKGDESVLRLGRKLFQIGRTRRRKEGKGGIGVKRQRGESKEELQKILLMQKRGEGIFRTALMRKMHNDKRCKKR